MVKKVGILIGEYNRSDASSVANFFEKEHHSQPIHLRETLLCGSWLAAKVPPTNSKTFPFVQDAVPKLPGGFNPGR